MAELRRVRPVDCRAGAVLAKDGALWDVLDDWKQGKCVRVRKDGSDKEEHVAIGHIGQYQLVRSAPDMEDVPVMDLDRDARRRERLDFGWLEKA